MEHLFELFATSRSSLPPHHDADALPPAEVDAPCTYIKIALLRGSSHQDGLYGG
jgi:hypothetical protein